MILGIASALLFILVAMKFLTKRLHLAKADKFMWKIHSYVGCAFAVLIACHLLISLKVFDSRPGYIYILGALSVLFAIFAVLSGIFRKRLGRKWFALHRISAAAAAIFIILHISSVIFSTAHYQREVSVIKIDSVDISTVPDGVYTGECDVTYIYAKVAVTVKSGRITEIKLLEHRNERGGSAEKITDNIISQQKNNVDTITGATNSSKVIEKAVEDALENQLEE